MLLWVSPAVAILLSAFGLVLAPDDSAQSVLFGAFALFGGCAGLVAIALYQRWIIGFIDPDPKLRSKILALGQIRPFGEFWAVRELLDQSVLRGGSKPV